MRIVNSSPPASWVSSAAAWAVSVSSSSPAACPPQPPPAARRARNRGQAPHVLALQEAPDPVPRLVIGAELVCERPVQLRLADGLRLRIGRVRERNGESESEHQHGRQRGSETHRNLLRRWLERLVSSPGEAREQCLCHGSRVRPSRSIDTLCATPIGGDPLQALQIAARAEPPFGAVALASAPRDYARACPALALWPAVLVLLLGALFILKTWLTGDAIRQERILQTIATVALVLLALVVWLLFLSRLARRVRFTALAVVLGLVALTAALVRVRGVTGDLRPIVELRFARPAPLPALPPASQPLALPTAAPATPAPVAASTPVPAAAAAPAPATSAPSVAARRRVLPAVPRADARRHARGPAARARLDGSPPEAALASADRRGLVGLRDRGRRRRHAGAARRRGARRGLRPALGPAALVARRSRRATRP